MSVKIYKIKITSYHADVRFGDDKQTRAIVFKGSFNILSRQKGEEEMRNTENESVSMSNVK